MVLYVKKENCSGCTACVNVCPNNAIRMVKNETGFWYPRIDKRICNECGLCKQVCPFNLDYDKNQLLPHPEIYGAMNKEFQERKTSSSGGLFVAISDFILDRGGVVYGAGYGREWEVRHKRAVTKAERNEMKGSKYVQSRLDNTFQKVKQDLERGKYVLFSGTPCQVAGLHSYLLPMLKEKLFTCDIICHGTPAPKIWSDYIQHIENKYRRGVVGVDFRDKEYGWHSHVESFYLGGNTKTKVTLGHYAALYQSNLMFRPSCYNCPYTNTKRTGDFTLGDFWGIDKIKPIMDDDKGLSLVFVNTEKGMTIFNQLSDDLVYFKSDIQTCKQENLCRPTLPGPNRGRFWRDYRLYGFSFILKKYGKTHNKVEDVINFARRNLP
jgi:coenzyme F420-reducing hydrogenase beta subunit